MKTKIFNKIEAFLNQENLAFSKENDNTIVILFSDKDKSIMQVILSFINDEYIMSVGSTIIKQQNRESISNICNNFNISYGSKLYFIEKGKKYYLCSEVVYSTQLFKGNKIIEWLKDSLATHKIVLQQYIKEKGLS